MPTIVDRNPHEIPLANFTVQSGANRLQRFGQTVASQPVENGYVKFGQVKQTNLTNSTDVPGGFWFVSHVSVSLSH